MSTGTDPLRGYYRVHSRIYDATRWSFLFGRAALIRAVCRNRSPDRILEIGCGTGSNLAAMRKQFPGACIAGVDLSPHMLDQARKRLGLPAPKTRLIRKTYDTPLSSGEPFDLVIFSYTLSMIHPGCGHVLECAAADLAPKGTIAAVDFHDSPVRAFKTWMRINHVRMDGHLLPELNSRFFRDRLEIRSAYAGAWQYFLYLGRKI